MQLMFPGQLIELLGLAMKNAVIPGSRLPTRVGVIQFSVVVHIKILNNVRHSLRQSK